MDSDSRQSEELSSGWERVSNSIVSFEISIILSPFFNLIKKVDRKRKKRKIFSCHFCFEIFCLSLS